MRVHNTCSCSIERIEMNNLTHPLSHIPGYATEWKERRESEEAWLSGQDVGLSLADFP